MNFSTTHENADEFILYGLLFVPVSVDTSCHEDRQQVMVLNVNNATAAPENRNDIDKWRRAASGEQHFTNI
jgi:hypothetical protein